MHEGWQTSGSVRVVRLAFNLYTDGAPSVDDYKRKDEQISRVQTQSCGLGSEYSVSDIFCCGYAMYFWEGIKLRYPEYCQKQRSIEEILAEAGCEASGSHGIRQMRVQEGVQAFQKDKGAAGKLQP